MRARTCLSENLLSAFIERQVSREELSLVHAHLDECPECRAIVGFVAGGSLSGSATTVPPSGAGIVSAGDAASTDSKDKDAGQAATPPDPPDPPHIEGYRIVRCIGRGSMGEVYLAQDEQLERPVAIKFLSATSEPAARRRFLAEARAVARLRHPNIVTIHSCDITGERPYIVSELLSGKSLDRVNVPLARDEAVRVAAALASGLAAAHRQGVLHRDLKPANAMRTDDGEIKLLDFGLAKVVGAAAEIEARPAQDPPPGPDVARRTMTRTGALVGTPLYMAPEVWRGEPATPASDVYSLGAMLYELCTGAPARRAKTMDGLRREIGESAPKPLRQAAPSVDPALAAAVDRCLARDPTERFPSAVELSAAIAAIAADQPKQGRMRRVLLAAVGVSVALSVGAAVIRARPTLSEPGPLASALDDTRVGARRSAAIMPFVNATGSPEAAWLAIGLSEMLAACLGAGESLRVVSGAEVARMLSDLELRGRASLSEDDLGRIRRYAGVDVLVMGAFDRPASGAGLKVKMRTQDTTSGAVVAVGEAEGTESAFQDVALLLGERLLPSFGQLPLSATQTAQIRAAIPGTPLAARLYAEGLERQRAGDKEAARERFERAAQAEPESPMPHYALSAIWASLAQEESERREAKLAFKQASSLLREQRLEVEARYYRAHRDKSRALETLRILHERFPDNIEHGIELAKEQPQEEAFATLASLRRSPPPASEDPRIDITEYQVASGARDRRVQAVKRAAAKARARGARLLVGIARNLEGWGEWDEGNIDRAEEAWNEALTILEPRGHIVDATDAMRGLGGIAMLRDDLDGALARFEAAEAHLRPSGNYASFIFALRNVASIFRLTGALDKSRAKLDEALAVSERSSNPARLSMTYTSIALLDYTAGDLPAARRALDRSVVISEEIRDERLGHGARGELGYFYMTVDQIDKARDAFERSLADKVAEGRTRHAATFRRQLASVAIEQGRLDEAARLLDEAMTEVQRESAPLEIALTAATQGLLHAARGARAEALSAVDGAMGRVARSKNLFTRLQVTLDWAHVYAAVGDAAQRARAEEVIAETIAAIKTAGYGVYAHDARFVACELLAARAPRAASRACFLAVEAAARKQGFLRSARKAAERAR